jgi:hypothetical protein
VDPNGRLATTRNGRRGGDMASASAVTTRTLPNPASRTLAHSASRGSHSTATTRPALRASASVSTPLPAPISTTRSPAPTPACSTSSAASRPPTAP